MSVIKKLLYFLSVLLSIIVLLTFEAYAVDFTVTTEEIFAEQGDIITIPVQLTCNKGIMGFKVSVDYPKEILSSPKVTRGAITSQGIFDSSINDSTNGAFDIVWTHTQNVTSDGLLFVLQFDVNEKANDGEYKIQLFPNQDDTFNEKWEDVLLSLSDIKIHIGTSDLTTDDTGKFPAETNHEKLIIDTETNISDILDVIDSDYIQNAIKNSLDKAESDSIQKMDDEQFSAFKDTLSDSLIVYDVQIKEDEIDKNYFLNLYEEAVEKSFIDDILASADVDVVSKVFIDTLDKYGVKSIDDLTSDQHESFVADVQEALEDNGADFEELPDGIDKIKIIQKLYSEFISGEDKPSSISTNKNISLMIITIVTICMFIAIIIAVIYKIKKGGQIE